MDALEKACSVLFFLSLMLNDTFGDVVGLHILSKSAILLFMIVSFFIMISRNVTVSPFFVCVLVLNMLWWGLSCIWTPGPTALISTLFQNLILCFFVYVFFSYYKNFDLLFYAMYFSGFLLMFYAMLVYGYDGFIQALEEGERVGKEITNQNTFGKVFAYSFVSGLYLFVYRNKKLLGLLSIIFVFFAFSSASKKAILIMIVASFVVMLLRYGMKNPFKFIALCVVVFLALYFTLQLPIFEVAYDRITTYMFGEGDASDQVRADMIADGWVLFKQNPIFGWGLQAFQEVTGHGVYSHNNFIEILANHGVIGFSLFYSIYIFLFVKLRHVVKYRVPSMVMMLAVLVSIVIMDYGNVSYAIKWNWIIIGAAMAMAFNTKSQSE